LLEYIVQIYNENDIERSIVCLKSMRRLLNHGFKQVHVHEANCRLVNLLATNMKSALGREGMDMYVVKAGKVFLSLVEKRPLEFVLIPGWLDIARMFWSVVEGGSSETVMVQGLVVLKNLIKHPGKHFG
jgi:hypothetical protein